LGCTPAAVGTRQSSVQWEDLKREPLSSRFGTDKPIALRSANTPDNPVLAQAPIPLPHHCPIRSCPPPGLCRISSPPAPDLSSLLASGLPPALAYSISDYAGSSPIAPPGDETAAGAIADGITILGVYSHTSAAWLYTAAGLVPTANHDTEILIPYWYNAATAGGASAIVAGGYWCGTTPPTTRPGTSHARAALWSSDAGWISEPTPGVGPAWTRPTNPLASVTGLYMA
jgi:hypothetical protein